MISEEEMRTISLRLNLFAFLFAVSSKICNMLVLAPTKIGLAYLYTSLFQSKLWGKTILFSSFKTPQNYLGCHFHVCWTFDPSLITIKPVSLFMEGLNRKCQKGSSPGKSVWHLWKLQNNKLKSPQTAFEIYQYQYLGHPKALKWGFAFFLLFSTFTTLFFPIFLHLQTFFSPTFLQEINEWRRSWYYKRKFCNTEIRETEK